MLSDKYLVPLTRSDVLATHEYVDDGSHDEGAPVCGYCGCSERFHDPEDAITITRGEYAALLDRANGVPSIDDDDDFGVGGA